MFGGRDDVDLQICIFHEYCLFELHVKESNRIFVAFLMSDCNPTLGCLDAIKASTMCNQHKNVGLGAFI